MMSKSHWNIKTLGFPSKDHHILTLNRNQHLESRCFTNPNHFSVCFPVVQHLKSPITPWKSTCPMDFPRVFPRFLHQNPENPWVFGPVRSLGAACTADVGPGHGANAAPTTPSTGVPGVPNPGVQHTRPGKRLQKANWKMGINDGISWWLNGISWWFNGISWWFNGISWWFNGI